LKNGFYKKRLIFIRNEQVIGSIPIIGSNA